MSFSARRWRRHRWMKLLGPTFFAVTILMVPLNFVLERQHVEVFPFFRWKLFTTVPEWNTTEYVLTVDAVDGVEVAGPQYLVPNSSIRDWKTVRAAGRTCRNADNCDDIVAELIMPIVTQSYGDRHVEFSILRANIDLRGISNNVASITDGTLSLTEFLHPDIVVGTWMTPTTGIAPTSE